MTTEHSTNTQLSTTGPNPRRRNELPGWATGSRLAMAASVAVVLLLGFAVGCSTGGGAVGSSSGPKLVNQQVGDTQWVYFRRPGGPETDQHLGFVRRRVLTFDDGTEVVHRLVLDSGDRSLGYYIEADGRTYQQTPEDPVPTEVGTFDAQGSLAQLFGRAGVYSLVREKRTTR